MEIVHFLIPIAILLGFLFLSGFIWMVKKGQYDDLETPGLRILLDDEKNNQIPNTNNLTQGKKGDL